MTTYRAGYYYYNPTYMTTPRYFTSHEMTAVVFAGHSYTEDNGIIVFGLDGNGDYL